MPRPNHNACQTTEAEAGSGRPKELLAIDAKRQHPPSTIIPAALHAGLEFDQGNAAKAFPDLARQIMERYKRNANKRIAERRGNIVAALRQAILKINGLGEFPTMERTRTELADPNWLRETWVRAEWKRIAASWAFSASGCQNKPAIQEPTHK